MKKSAIAMCPCSIVALSKSLSIRGGGGKGGFSCASGPYSGWSPFPNSDEEMKTPCSRDVPGPRWGDRFHRYHVSPHPDSGTFPEQNNQATGPSMSDKAPQGPLRGQAPGTRVGTALLYWLRSIGHCYGLLDTWLDTTWTSTHQHHPPSHSLHRQVRTHPPTHTASLRHK